MSAYSLQDEQRYGYPEGGPADLDVIVSYNIGRFHRKQIFCETSTPHPMELLRLLFTIPI